MKLKYDNTTVFEMPCQALELVNFEQGQICIGFGTFGFRKGGGWQLHAITNPLFTDVSKIEIIK